MISLPQSYSGNRFRHCLFQWPPSESVTTTSMNVELFRDSSQPYEHFQSGVAQNQINEITSQFSFRTYSKAVSLNTIRFDCRLIVILNPGARRSNNTAVLLS